MNWWRRKNKELDEEIRSHSEMATRDRIEQGEAPKKTEFTALRELANRTRGREIIPTGGHRQSGHGSPLSWRWRSDWTRRASEIGIRMALVAARQHVTEMVLKDASWMVCAGLAVGIPLVIWSKRFTAGLAVNVSIPIAFGALALLAITLLAAQLA